MKVLNLQIKKVEFLSMIVDQKEQSELSFRALIFLCLKNIFFRAQKDIRKDKADQWKKIYKVDINMN